MVLFLFCFFFVVFLFRFCCLFIVSFYACVWSNSHNLNANWTKFRVIRTSRKALALLFGCCWYVCVVLVLIGGGGFLVAMWSSARQNDYGRRGIEYEKRCWILSQRAFKQTSIPFCLSATVYCCVDSSIQRFIAFAALSLFPCMIRYFVCSLCCCSCCGGWWCILKVGLIWFGFSSSVRACECFSFVMVCYAMVWCSMVRIVYLVALFPFQLFRALNVLADS